MSISLILKSLIFISPFSKSKNLRNNFAKVVFPLPDSPTNAIFSPFFIFIFIFFNICSLVPYLKSRFFISISPFKLSGIILSSFCSISKSITSPNLSAETIAV